MSIRYTIRHNIPSAKIMAEDVNDSSTWDLDLIRKHELAETTDHDIVYRQHDGRIVNLTEGATQRAALILQQVQDVKSEIEQLLGLASENWDDIREVLADAHSILDRTEDVLDQSMQAKSSSEQSSNLAKNWATKMGSRVIENGQSIDYSSKYYAQQSQNSAQNAQIAGQVAQDAMNLIIEHNHDLEFISNFRIVDGHLYQVMEV